MPKKKSSKRYNIDEEIIIGYNTSKKKDKPSKKSAKKVNNKKNNSKNKNQKKEKRSKIKKILLALLKISIIIGVFVGVFAFLFISPVFNITEIKVENAEKISENTYIALSEIEIGENIFKITKSSIKNKIKEEPYAEEVEIIREYPGTVVISVKERTAKYLIEKDGIYIYVDKNGYLLEKNAEKLDLPILYGIETDLDIIEMGKRLSETDLSKFNDLIKITDGIKNNNIQAKISSIDISKEDNYVINFDEENKKVILGDSSNLKLKMDWIKYFIQQEKNKKGIIHLNTDNVYFEPY